MKDWAEIITKYFSGFVEILEAVVIGIALLQFLYHYIGNIFKHSFDLLLTEIKGENNLNAQTETTENSTDSKIKNYVGHHTFTISLLSTH